MRLVHWLFVISAALFVSGISFLVVSARTLQAAPEIEAPPTKPVATIKQIMRGVVAPSATVVFNAVGTIVTMKGTEERRPRTDEEWDTVGNSAAALIEAGNLLMLEGRAIDSGDWMKLSRTLMDSTAVALKATQDKNVDELFGSVDAINATCDNCHQKYQRQ